MIYRELGKTGIKVSEVGLGCEHLQGMPRADVANVVAAALDHGMNILDVFMSEPNVRSDIGLAIKGRREKVVLQGHIGSVWKDRQYGQSRISSDYIPAFEDFLTRMGTDYCDLGLLHFIDTESELDKSLNGGLLDHALKLKQEGKIRAIGLSSHDPVIAGRLVDTGLIDMVMFSVNPAWDLLPSVPIDDFFGDEAFSGAQLTLSPERQTFYRKCLEKGVGITVMKALAAGRLLDAARSPFGRAMSVHQLIHYALTRPAVASVLVGCKTPAEVAAAAAYEDADDAARDYTSVLSAAPRFSMNGACMYCNHCLPCPAEIDIARVGEYLDLAETAGLTPTISSHYAQLSAHGGDCLSCGACEARCPFGVNVRGRMAQAKKLFGM